MPNSKTSVVPTEPTLVSKLDSLISAITEQVKAQTELTKLLHVYMATVHDNMGHMSAMRDVAEHLGNLTGVLTTNITRKLKDVRDRKAAIDSKGATAPDELAIVQLDLMAATEERRMAVREFLAARKAHLHKKAEENK